MFTRLHIIPHLGGKRLDKIQVKDIRQWLNKLADLPVLRLRAKTPPGQKIKGAAARSGNAATKCFPRKP